MQDLDGLERSRQQLIVWLSRALLFLIIVLPPIAYFVEAERGVVYAAIIAGCIAALAGALVLGRRGRLNAATTMMGLACSLTPLTIAYIDQPVTTAVQVTGYSAVGILVISAFGRARHAALLALFSVGAILALPVARPLVPLDSAVNMAFFVALTSSLSALIVRVRERSAAALAEAAEAARRGEQSFRAISATAPVPILLVATADRRLRFLNDLASAMFGGSTAELRGARLSDLVEPQAAEALDRLLEQVIRTGELHDFEFRIAGDIWFSVHATLLDKDAQEVVLSFNDITTHKQAESALKRARDQAEAAKETRTHFLANISHELRTPLNGVTGMLHLLGDTPLDEDQRVLVDRAQRSADSLLTIIDDVLDFAKLEAGKMDVTHLELDVEEVIFECLDLLAERADAKGIELTATLAPDVPARVRGDPTRLRQILVNLVSNAVKFTDEGHVSVRCEHATIDDEIGVLAFQVEDTGVGIAPEDQMRLFEAFRQVNPASTRDHGGTGLGLAITKELVELLGGQIDLRSVPGEGTTFEFEVVVELLPEAPAMPGPKGLAVAVAIAGPATRAAVAETLRGLGARVVDDVGDAEVVFADHAVETAARVVRVTPLGARQKDGLAVRAPVRPSALRSALAESAPFPRAQGAAPPPARGRLLVAEDNETNQLVARMLLERLGFEVEIVENGQAAVERATRADADYVAILMDCRMPILDGIDATRQIREREGARRVPIVAITAHAADHDLCYDAGMDGYVPKPLNPDRLQKELERVNVR